MTTRTLVTDNAQVSVYEIRDDQGVLVGTDAVGKPALEEVNRQTVEDRLRLGLQANEAFRVLPSPTTNQVNAQVKALAKTVTALVKLQLDLLGDTTGT